MKSIYKLAFLGLLTLGIMSSCSEDLLETSPTTSVDTGQLMGSTSKAIGALNGIYRFMYTADYTSRWQHEEFGITAFNHVADLEGEDMIQQAAGSGWFWYDYQFDVKGDYTHNGGRPYGTWNFFYTIISNANYLIAADATMTGDEKEKNYIVGQAYALRAFGYFYLAQFYARNLVDHPTDPCVPIYTEPTVKGTKGKPRATTTEVYQQINSDIKTAIEKMKAAKTVRDSKSHLGLGELYGLAARIALVEEKWQEAKTYAESAIVEAEKENIGIAVVSNFLGLNKVDYKNVMWGLKIVSNQSTQYGSYFTHMDADLGKYGATARIQGSKVLYALMGEKDERRIWWNPKDKHNGFNEDSTEVLSGYQQEKLKFSNKATFEGDYILMRIEEMYLIKAEAECMLGDDVGAQQSLMVVMEQRDVDYYCVKTGKELAVTSNPLIKTGSLREEIINQRRIELWGEFGRIFDIRRLHQGVYRSQEQGHPSAALVKGIDNKDSYKWVMTIPQSEFDGNSALDPQKDQTPMD